MKFKESNGFTGIDIVIAIVAIMIFSTLIITMMHNNVIENVKLKKENLAMIYITEILENVGIHDYDDPIYDSLGTEFTQINNANVLIPQAALNEFKIEMAVTTNLDGVTYNADILKKVKVKLTYNIANKTYTCSMERMKIKE